jgi:hypothetical protein
MSQTTRLVIGVILLLIGAAVILVSLTAEKPEPEIIDEIETPIAPATPTTTQSVIGQSVEGRNIEVVTFGNGETDLLFVGGIHGGYEWNTIQFAYELIDHLHTNEKVIPDNVTVHIVPNLNPDGLYLATGLEGKIVAGDITDYSMHAEGVGRMNANGVDINRNFDCRWTETGVWRGKTVSAGTVPFSEPEAEAIRDYIEMISPEAAIFWHSKAGNVYGAECNGGVVDANTLTLMQTYADAAGYGKVPVFDAYAVTGAVEDWLAASGIPTVSVEFTTRTSSEFDQNLAGTIATLDLYGK